MSQSIGRPFLNLSPLKLILKLMPRKPSPVRYLH